VVERGQLGRSQSLVEGLTLAFVLVLSATAAAQPAEPKVTGTVSNITRVESWSYFEPRIRILAPTEEPIGEPSYTFIGDRAELGVRVDGERFDLSGAFNYVRLENLPTDAIGPGGFGSGAFYFAATGVSYSYQLYLSELLVKVKSRDRNRSLTLGRMAFSSGVRLHPPSNALSGDGATGLRPGLNRSVERLTQERLQSRLIGNFEWSYYQRRFDGARFDLDRGRWQYTAAAFVPTQGGFEESTNLSMPKVQVAVGSATRTGERSESQGFAYLYRDRRRGPFAVVDNTFSIDQPVSILAITAGGSHARVAPTRSGELDAVAWGAVQTGDWYGAPHRAASAAFEAGHRWSSAPMRPWLRAGYLWSSGDDDPRDGRHGTFFQMLPSSRKYALSSVYAQMNLRDAFLQAWIEPRRFSSRIEVHRVSLASGRDLWYQGSGATASRDRFFGFSGRAAGGETSLGTVLEGTVDVPIRNYWSVNGYAGTMWGGGVVSRMFTGTRLTFWSIENVIRF
jgi:hypothetical protein